MENSSGCREKRKEEPGERKDPLVLTPNWLKGVSHEHFKKGKKVCMLWEAGVCICVCIYNPHPHALEVFVIINCLLFP